MRLDCVGLRSARWWLGWLRGWHQERENDERVPEMVLHVGIGGRRRRHAAELPVASSAGARATERGEEDVKKK